MATAARELGLFELATRPQEEAFALLSNAHGPASEIALESSIEWMKLLCTVDQFEEARSLARERLHWLPREEARHRLVLLSILGRASRGLGEFPVALGYLEEACELGRSQFGLNHGQTLAAMNHLASVYEGLERFEASKDLLEEILTSQTLTPKKRATYRHNLAGIPTRAGSFRGCRETHGGRLRRAR